MRRPALGVFLILWASYAYFWHSRDWNTASRLMLTYSLVDRGTIRIDGLENQTGDRSLYRGHSYSDKLPGYSFFAAVPYALFKRLMAFPDHPLNAQGFTHWTPDYAVTLFTSGLVTALCGSLLTVLAMDLGCGPRRAAIVGLAYGLATHAYAYATLAHGHQTSAACLLGAFALLWRPSLRETSTREGKGWAGDGQGATSKWAGVEVPADRAGGTEASPSLRRDVLLFQSALAGFLAAYAGAVELQVAPVCALIGLYALMLVIGGKRPAGTLVAFALGALVPTSFLMIYNTAAFGSPLRMGYFYHATQQFADVHSASNPLGLRAPDWSRADDLTIRPARGLFWYAPITLLTIPGLVTLVARRYYGMAIICAGAVASVFLVNLSYPEWSGGWSSGPRLLTPMLPFAVLPSAALMAVGGRFATALAASLSLVGGLLMFLLQGIGGRVPEPVREPPPGYDDPRLRPLTEFVIPIWRGEPLPEWVFNQRFARNLVMVARPEAVAALPASWQWVQYVPLAVFQVASIAFLFLWLRQPRAPRPDPDPRADPAGGRPPARPDPA